MAWIPAAMTLASGGVTTGEIPMIAGDRVLPVFGPVISDGRTFWRLELRGEREEAHAAWREYDPSSGRPIRFSQPRFFEDGPEPVLPEQSVLLPLDDAVTGVRVWRTDDQTMGSDVDGRVVSAHVPSYGTLGAVLLVPGSAEPRAVSATRLHYTLHDPETGQAASRSDPADAVPPLLWSPFLVPRVAGAAVAL
jgi:hypothetical protein